MKLRPCKQPIKIQMKVKRYDTNGWIKTYQDACSTS